MLTITLPQLKWQLKQARRLSKTNYCQKCGERAGLLRRLGQRLVCEGCWSEG